MKRGKILFSIIFSLMVFIPFKVSAASNVMLVGPASVGPGTTVVYDITLTSTDIAKNIKTELTYDSTVLELISIVNKDWQGTNTVGASPKTLEFLSNGANGKSVVASLSFKVKSSTTKTSTSLKLSGSTISVISNATEAIVTSPEVTKNINITSTDATLSSLKINDKEVSGFRSKTLNYNVIVDSSVEQANIKATLSNSNASFVELFGPREVPLNYGVNKVLIKTKAESGDVKVYTVNITREDTRTTNNYLKDIIINGGKISIDFDKLVLDYSIKTYKLDQLEIEAQPEDEKAVVKIDKPQTIIVGENVVKIEVKSENGKIQVYTLTFINSDQEIDTKLKNLSIKGQQINFDQNKLDYELVFDKSMKDGIKIYATALSQDAKIDISGNEDLKVGSKIKIRVSAEDGSETIYTITMIKDKRINFFMILELLIIVVLIVLIIIQIVKRKKTKKGKNANDEKQEKKEGSEVVDLNDSPTLEMDTTEFKF